MYFSHAWLSWSEGPPNGSCTLKWVLMKYHQSSIENSFWHLDHTICCAAQLQGLRICQFYTKEYVPAKTKFLFFFWKENIVFCRVYWCPQPFELWSIVGKPDCQLLIFLISFPVYKSSIRNLGFQSLSQILFISPKIAFDLQHSKRNGKNDIIKSFLPPRRIIIIIIKFLLQSITTPI